MEKLDKGDLISRSALLEELTKRLSIVQRVGVEEIVASVPAVEAEPVVHAHWVAETYGTYIPVEYDENGDLVVHKYTRYKCSVCGRIEREEEAYCNCGAYMDERVKTGYCPLCEMTIVVVSNDSMGKCPKCGHHIVLHGEEDS